MYMFRLYFLGLVEEEEYCSHSSITIRFMHERGASNVLVRDMTSLRLALLGEREICGMSSSISRNIEHFYLGKQVIHYVYTRYAYI
jgi:hypothetical protein